MQDLREKLTLRGVESLTDLELLAILLEDMALAEELIKECGSLVNIAKMPSSRLRMVAGLGMKRAERLQVAIEMGHRVVSASNHIEEQISSSEDVIRIMHPLLKDLKHEECWAIYLTNSNRIIECSRISQGGIQATVVDHRLIVKRALELLSTRIIIVHNHPSGSATPSPQDRALTDKVRAAAQLFDIELTDHVIVASTGHYSFRASGELR